MRTIPRKVTLAATSLVAALSLAIAGCTTTPPPADVPDTIRIGVTPDQLSGVYHPTTASLSVALDQRAVYESLFTPNSSYEAGSYDPVLATGFEQSEDWKTVTLSLREGVTFVDGEEFNAEALKTYLDGMGANDAWSLKASWDGVSPTLTVVDDYTLEISSDSPMPVVFGRFLYSLFTQTPIASPSMLDDLATEELDAVGSGPYVVEAITPGVEATLVRNENYWNPDAFPFDTIELTVFADDVAAQNALTAGQIDAAKLNMSLAGEAESQGFTLNVESANGTTDVLYIADRFGETNPALGDSRVRQAMALAFDREAIDEALSFGRGVVTSQPFIEGQAGYVPDGDTQYGYDPERAKELLAEAGYPDGFDLTIISTPFFGISSNEPVVAQYLGDIGIRVKFETLEVGAFFDVALNSKEATVIMYQNLFLATFVYFIATDSVFNPFKLQDPVVDDLWQKIQNGPTDVADEAANDLGEYVVDESLLVVYRAAPNGIWVTAEGFVVPYFYAIPLLSDFQYAD